MIKILFLFICVLLLNLIACSQKLNVDASQNQTDTTVPPSPVGNTDLEKGTQLYTTNCSICHNPLATSTKLGKTSTDIQNALQNIGAMASLKTLSAGDINLIALALSAGTLTGNPNDGLTIQPVLANRYQMAAHLKELFIAATNPDASDTQIQIQIDNLITNHPEGFGGNCSRNDPGCVAAPCAGGATCRGLLTISQTAQVSPSASAIRKGYHIQACEKILAIDKAVTTVSAKAGVDPQLVPDVAAINKLILFMARDRAQDLNSSTKLLSVATTLSAASASNFDQWRGVILAICQAAPSDLL